MSALIFEISEKNKKRSGPFQSKKETFQILRTNLTPIAKTYNRASSLMCSCT